MKILLKKVMRRVLQIAYRYIPLNSSLKPVSSQLSKEYSLTHADVTYLPVYPGHHNTLDLPKDLFDLEETKITDDLPEVSIVSVNNGRVYSDAVDTVAVITNDNVLLEDVSLEYRSQRKLKGNSSFVFTIKYFPKPRHYSGTVFNMLIGGSGPGNYFHWLLDVVPRIHLLRKSGLYDSVTWFLLPSQKQPYQKDTLALLGIPTDKIIEGDKPIHVRADKIITPSPHRHARLIQKWTCDYLRETFLGHIQIRPIESKKNIYLTRNDSPQRNVLNEAELLSSLRNLGFEQVSLSGMSFLEQVKLFHSADIILSPHGASLANLTFCKKGARVIELFSESWPGNDYFQISKLNDLSYYYIISRITKKARSHSVAKRQHFKVDIPAIVNLLAHFEEFKNEKLG